MTDFHIGYNCSAPAEPLRQTTTTTEIMMNTDQPVHHSCGPGKRYTKALQPLERISLASKAEASNELHIPQTIIRKPDHAIYSPYTPEPCSASKEISKTLERGSKSLSSAFEHRDPDQRCLYFLHIHFERQTERHCSSNHLDRCSAFDHPLVLDGHCFWSRRWTRHL